MKAITLRNIPAGIARRIRAKAREDKTSINKAVIAMLLDSLEPRRPESKILHHDLDDLAGSWSQAEADDFDRALREQRQIDADLWK